MLVPLCIANVCFKANILMLFVTAGDAAGVILNLFEVFSHKACGNSETLPARKLFTMLQQETLTVPAT